MGASLALAGMTGCIKQPLEEIVPYVVQPEDITPGVPKFYATAFTLSGYAIPLLVESNMGRPTKIEGNPQHAACYGASDIFSQASLLDLYDPDRMQTVTYNGEASSWFAFVNAIRAVLLNQPGPANPLCHANRLLTDPRQSATRLYRNIQTRAGISGSP